MTKSLENENTYLNRRKLLIGAASLPLIGSQSPIYSRATNGRLTSDHFGVKANGNAFDAPRLQEFIDYCSVHNLTAELPAGTMQLGESTLSVHSGMSIMGQGDLTEFRSEGGSTAIILNTSSLKTPDIAKRIFVPSLIQGFSVRHTTGSIGRPRSGCGIWMRNATRTHLRGVAVRGYKIGIDTRGASWSSSVTESWIIGNETGFLMGATDVDFNAVGKNGNLNDVTYSGFNGGSIIKCEIQANDVGIHAPYEMSQSRGRHIAHGMNIFANIIEGNLKASIVLSGQQRGTNIFGNYFESNAAKSQFTPEKSIPSWEMDWREVKAHIVFQEDFYGFGANARVRDNHFVQQNDIWAIYQGRGKGNIYEGNEGFVSGIYAQQDRGDSATLGLTARDNNFKENFLSEEILQVSTIRNIRDIPDTDPRNSLKFHSISPEKDFVQIGEMTGDFKGYVEAGKGWAGTGRGEVWGYMHPGDEFKNCWQVMVDNGGIHYRRTANSAAAWNVWLRS